MKLRVLVAIHLALTASPLAVQPLAMLFRPNSIWLLPVNGGAQSVLVGQLMLLAFWAGLGTSGRAWRITGTVAGTSYVALWSTSPHLLSLWNSPNSSWTDGLGECGKMFLQSGLLVLIAGAMFLIMRRWFSHLERAADARQTAPTSRYQFSIQHLLVITTVTAMFLATSRGEWGRGDQWKLIMAIVLFFGTCVANAIYAVRGTLSLGPTRWRLFLVLVVAVLLGIGITLITGIATVSWWLGALMALTMTVPTLVVVLSLLVVRSCGYRLVPNPPARKPRVLNVSA